MTAPTVTDTKTCTSCGHTKPRTEYHVDRTKPDGRRYVCKPCARGMTKAAADRHRSRGTIPTPATLGCSRCKRELPADAFTPDRSTKSGRAHYCRRCAAEYRRQIR